MKIGKDWEALWAIGGLCLLLGACSNASAKPSSQTKEPMASAKHAVSTMSDEERSKFVQSLAPRLSRSTRGLSPKRTQTGSHRIDLSGKYSHMVVATRSADGKVQQSCVSTPEELNELLVEKQERDRKFTGGRP
jgi:hypothetical protein